MDFYKYHGLGNDYIVMDPQKREFKMSKHNIKLICDRNFGAGSDGILYGPVNPVSADKPAKLRIFNPDGSEAEKSGNGIRIFAKYLVDSRYVKGKSFKIETKGGMVNVEKLKDDATLLKVDMGKVTFTSKKIPVSGAEREVVREDLRIDDTNFKITCLSIGNPHCVIHLDEISPELAKSIGPKIESNTSLFPNRINVQFVKILDRKNIQIEIYERGAGYTLASGSSSCAVASASFKLGLVDNNVTVHMPGGKLEIEVNNDFMVRMIGPVASVCKGNFTDDFIKILGW
jgi:diaminopimelate epimerase